MNKLDSYAELGLHNIVSGLEQAIGILQEELARHRAVLEGLQEARVNGVLGKKLGRPPKNPALVAAGVKTGGQSWAGMTPEERSAEMKRRMAKRKHNGSNSDLQRRAWANLTPAQRKKRIAAVAEGKRKAQAAREAAAKAQ